MHQENDKIRIAIYCRTLPEWGGSYQYARAFTKALSKLDKNKFEVRLWNPPSIEWENFANTLNLRNYNFSAGSKPYIYAIYRHLRRKFLKKDDFNLPFSMLRFKPHIVISPQMGGIYHPKAFNISCIHDLMHRYEMRFPEAGSREEFVSREKMFNDLILHCNYVLVDSQVGKKHCLESYFHATDEQVKILPFVAYDEVTKCTPQKPHFSTPKKFIFYPAQFWLHKNHTNLARAVALLKDKYSDICIITTGYTSKNGYGAFCDECNKLGIVDQFIVPGYVADEQIAWLYKNATAFVMPSFFGPTNIPPLEAMAFGCPAAVSDIYGMRERFGDNVLYFEPTSPSSIAKALENLWTNESLRQGLISKGLAYTQEHGIDFFESSIHNLIKSIPIKNKD